jgi:hypothetical protein
MSRRTFGSVQVFRLCSCNSHYASDNTDAKEDNKIASVLEQKEYCIGTSWNKRGVEIYMLVAYRDETMGLWQVAQEAPSSRRELENAEKLEALYSRTGRRTHNGKRGATAIEPR